MRVERAMQMGARGAAAVLRRVPGVRQAKVAWYERAFPLGMAGSFHGVYATADEALAAIPKSLPRDYDNAGAASMYTERLAGIYGHDYPVLYWMKPLMRPGRRVFDLGGHIGIAFYTYEPYLGTYTDLAWKVCDLPAVAEAGRALAARKNRAELSFTSRYEDLEGHDILYASGSLQYVVAPTLMEMLARTTQKPEHVFINMLPVTDRETYYTLNYIGAAICPYVIRNRAAFEDGVKRTGYELVDSWENAEKRCTIPLHPEHSVEGYRGYYFRRI